jgi:hypothetical protein
MVACYAQKSKCQHFKPALLFAYAISSTSTLVAAVLGSRDEVSINHWESAVSKRKERLVCRTIVFFNFPPLQATIALCNDTRRPNKKFSNRPLSSQRDAAGQQKQSVVSSTTWETMRQKLFYLLSLCPLAFL